MGVKPHYEHDSLEFYRTHATRYAELSQGFWDNGYTNCSHPNFRGDRDLYQRLTQLVPVDVVWTPAAAPGLAMCSC